MQSVSCNLLGKLSLVPTFAKATELFFDAFSGDGLTSAIPSEDATAKSIENGLPGHGHNDAASGDYVRQYLQFVEVVS